MTLEPPSRSRPGDPALRAIAAALPAAALLLLLLSAVAFWPAYLSKVRAAEGYTHAHAALGTAWLLLLGVQPVLARKGLRSAHRALGRAGAAVGIAFAISGFLVAHRSVARMGAEQFAREGHFAYLPLAMAAIFAAALALAIRWRSVPALHGRYMAATALPLLDPVLARILYFHGPPLPSESLYQAPAFLLATGALFALARSLPAAATGRGGFVGFACGVVAALLGFFVVPHTAPWLAFVTWWRALPIT